MQSLAIQTKELTKHFGNVKALDELSIEVPAGSIFGFLGPNGSGKTTAIRLLLGLLKPDSGGAEVLGFDTQKNAIEIRSLSGALLEHTGLYERLSAEDNLEFYGRIAQLSASERKARIKELLTHIGLWERRKDRVDNWSRGMKQKLAVARALLHRPSLIFLDEPTAGLDPVAAVAFRNDITSLVNKEGTTVFLTTHNLDEAEKVCNKVGVIRYGKLVASGTLNELRSQGNEVKLEITARGLTDAVLNLVQQNKDVIKAGIEGNAMHIKLNAGVETAPIVSILVNAGVELEEVKKDKASLEKVFLTLMENEGH